MEQVYMPVWAAWCDPATNKQQNKVKNKQTNKQKQQNYEPVQFSITVCMVTAEQMNK